MLPKPSTYFQLWDGACRPAPDTISIWSARFLDARSFRSGSSEVLSRAGKIQTEAPPEASHPAAHERRDVRGFAPESGQSNLLRAVQDHGLRRENDKAYAPSRMSIKGSSDSSIPSVSWPGRKSNFFSASALSGTTLSTVKTPSSATLRSSGQATDGSLVESPAAASCAFR